MPSSPGPDRTKPPDRDAAIGIVIPVLDDEPGLRRCLEALEGQVALRASATVVVVVDNGPSPAIERLCDRFPFVRYRVERSPGSYAARNTGVLHLRRLGCTYVGFTDSDCEPTRTWIERATDILSTSAADALAGAVDVVAMDPGSPTPTEIYDIVTGFPIAHYVRRHGFAPTANLWVKGNVLDQVGLFDSDLRSGGDLEWGQRFTSMGFDLAYAPDVIVRHPARANPAAMRNKVRRVLGGHVQRARRDGGAALVRTVARGLLPPVSRLARIAVSTSYSAKTRVIASLVEVRLYGVRLREIVRLLAGGDPLR